VKARKWSPMLIFCTLQASTTDLTITEQYKIIFQEFLYTEFYPTTLAVTLAVTLAAARVQP